MEFIVLFVLLPFDMINNNGTDYRYDQRNDYMRVDRCEDAYDQSKDYRVHTKHCACISSATQITLGFTFDKLE